MVTKQSFTLWFNRNRLEMLYGNPHLSEKMEWFIKKIDENESYALYKSWLELVHMYLMEESGGAASVRPQALRELKQLIQLYVFPVFIEEIKPELKEIVQSFDMDSVYIRQLMRAIDQLTGDAITLHELVNVSESVKHQHAVHGKLLPSSFDFLAMYFQTIHHQMTGSEKKAT